MTLGEKIQILRKSHGWSQEELASQLSVSRQALSKWELGTSIPDTENVLNLSKLFCVSTDYLLNDDYKNYEEILYNSFCKPTSSFKYKDHIRLITGILISTISSIVIIVIMMLASIHPSECTVFDTNGTKTYEGLAGFLMINNINWIFIISCFLFTIGILIISAPLLLRCIKKLNQYNILEKNSKIYL